MTIETAFNALVIAVLIAVAVLGICLAVSVRRHQHDEVTAYGPVRLGESAHPRVQFEANTEEFVRALRSVACALAGGHDFPTAEFRRLCDPAVTTSTGPCIRCGTLPPVHPDPLLWEGDQA